MKTLVVLLAASLAPVWAQTTLRFNFDSLAAKASEKAEVDLDKDSLDSALALAGKSEKLPANISHLTVRNYEFKKSGEYSDADLAGLREQVKAGTGWSRILSVKEKNESTEIYSLSGKPGAFLLISAEEKELSVVYIVGTVELAQLQELVNSSIKYAAVAPPDKK